MVASMYMQTSLPLEEFLTMRCHALLAIAQYIKIFFPGASYATRQALLIDTEKAEAARKLWRVWGRRMDNVDGSERVTQVLESVVKDMHREITGEAIYIDVVRGWFKHDVLHAIVKINGRFRGSGI
jgi:hypothetical protein